MDDHRGAHERLPATLPRKEQKVKTLRYAAVIAALLMPAVAQAQSHAHVHGVAKLDIAVEAGRITLQLDSPLENLLGFERAPRTEAERKQADAAVAKLRAADRLFRIDPAAHCTLTSMELTSAALKLGTPGPAADKGGHADIEGAFEFTCRNGSQAAHIEIGLFEAFSHMRRVDLQVATPAGQFKRELKRPAKRIALRK